MTPITDADVAAMDDMAAWSAANVLPILKTAKPVPTLTQQADAAYAAKRVREDVGRYTPGLEYAPAWCMAIGESVTVGFNYSPAEPGDDEQPEIGEDFDLQEVWLRGVNIAALVDDETADKLLDAIKAADRCEP